MAPASATETFVSDVSDFGARCDGVFDDGPAFQAASEVAYANGGTLLFRSPHCRLNEAIHLEGTPGGDFRITGDGSGHVMVTGRGFLLIKPPPPSASRAVDIGGFSIENLSGRPAGNFIVIDNSRVGFDGINRAHFHDIYATGYRHLITLIDSQDARGERIFGKSGAPTDDDIDGIRLYGESSVRQRWTLNSIWERNTFVGGIGFHLIGAIQGVNLEMNKCVACAYGVLNERQDLQEGFVFSHNYWEGYYAGAKMTRAAFLQIDGDSADLLGASVSPRWHAFWIGRDATGKDFPLGIELHNTMVFGIGAARSAPFYVGATAGVISNNQVIGLAGNVGNCFDVESAPAANAMLVLNDNSCWAARGFDTNGTSVRAHHDLWSGSHDDTVIEFPDAHPGATGKH